MPIPLGVQKSSRTCSNPIPQHGGKYCLGIRKRYRSCNTDTNCDKNTVDFRLMQCKAFNVQPFRAQFYDWKPVNMGNYNVNKDNTRSCALNCMPEGRLWYTEFKHAVTDGTLCDSTSSKNDVCIDGACYPVGCDKKLGSQLEIDSCGICGGDSSTCVRVKGKYMVGYSKFHILVRNVIF